ncbi:hypothetical protein AAG570_002410 [Ranatra chinensis]|uniref:Nucleoporin NDC1 n=1 Tax=Ranatra chinensis TaxID=642074 RepID=A0ABD0Y8F3_9HEMI
METMDDLGAKVELGRELCLGRLLTASCWTLALQLCLLIGWSAVLQSLSSPSSWSSALAWWHPPLLILALVSQALFSCNDYLIEPQLNTNRLKIFLSKFSFRNLIVLTLYTTLGTSLALVYTSSGGSSAIWLPCEGDPSKWCLQEERFFLILGGLFLGTYFFLHDYLLAIRSFKFPILQQCKFTQLKSRLSSVVTASVRSTSAPVSVYVTAYYVWGKSARNVFCWLFSVSPPDNPIDSFFSLLRPSILFYFWLVACMVTISVRLTELLFNIWLTERHMFPLTSDSALTLKEALGGNSPRIIRHLACLDFYLMSAKDRDRRRAVFELSQPGGHPHTWNAIKTQCFALINDFVLGLEKGSRPTPEEPPIRLIRRPLHICHGEANKESLADPFRRPSIQHTDPLVRIFTNLRDWSLIKWAEVSHFQFISYFVGELSESKIDNLLLGGEQVMWVAHGLSHLACHSLEEDNYGVMQNDLPSIITSLLRLKVALDRIVKQGGLLKKSPKHDEFSFRMRNAMRASVKRSIYRLAIHFKMYILDLHLPKEIEQQMLTFVAFKAV